MPLPFLKKKEEAFPAPRAIAPTERVKELANKGFSEPEMIDVLRKEGYSPSEIDRALSEALKSSVTSKQEEKPALPTIEELIPKQETRPEVPETSLPQEYYDYPIEEYLDALIQSRISEIDEKIREFSVKYEEVEKRVSTLSEQLTEVVKSRTEEQQQIIQKLEGFKETIEEMNIRLANLEKAFKDALPALIESVRALSDIVYKLKSS